MTRGAPAALGRILLTIGLAGVLTLEALSASADERSTADTHAVMHDMMDPVDGSVTSESMHRVDGGEQVMKECSQMHEQMQGMMDQGMPESMMGRGICR